MRLKVIKALTIVAIILALSVTMLGAYTRLTDSGLGCPDWPACYGKFILPKISNGMAEIKRQYPTVEAEKAWTEMAHRYAAGTLGLLIFCIVFLSIYSKGKLIKNKKTSIFLSILVGLVIFQAALGMWTVTFKLMPIVVVSHLLGGIFIFVFLCLYLLQLSEFKSSDLRGWRKLILVAFILLLIQIILGGLVSANYAGLACVGFPTCNGSWIPNVDLSKGFYIIEPRDFNYEGGVLSYEARILVQYIHRVFALIVGCYIIMIGLVIGNFAQNRFVKFLLSSLVILVMLQILFGIINVLYLLPIWSAVLHNGCAALLLAVCSCLLWISQEREQNVV